MLLITLADFMLGLFVGTYALASFAPAHLAGRVYRGSWLFCIAFVGLAYLQSTMKPVVIPTAQAMKQSAEFSSSDIMIFGAAVLLGIAIMLIGGLSWLYRDPRFAAPRAE